MTSREESKLNMYDALVSFGIIPANAAIILTVLAFDALFTILKAKLSTLKGVIAIEGQIITGIATDKGVLKTNLCDMVCDIAAVVSAYAVSINNNELREAMSLQPSECKATDDGEVEGKCQNIHDAANTHILALAPYGITAPMLATLQTTINNYAAKVAGPRNAISNRAAQKTARKNLYKEIDALLKTQMDKIAVQFKAANIDFYNEYKQNRIIIDPAKAKTKAAGTVTNSADDTAVKGVTVATTVNGNPVTTTTNTKGKYYLPLPPGTYTLTFTKTGFQTKQVINVVITLSQTTTIDVTLIPV